VFAVCLLLCGRTHAQPLSGRPAASSTGHAPGHAHWALQHLAHRRGAVQDQRRDLRPADDRNHYNYAHGACAEILLPEQTPRVGHNSHS